jgi:hypothetical protein
MWAEFREYNQIGCDGAGDNGVGSYHGELMQKKVRKRVKGRKRERT